MTAIGAAPTGLPADGRRKVLQRRVRLVVVAIIGYNVVEAIVAITAGSIASSAALVSFGLDSCVEVLSAAAIGWQFSAADHEKREKVALRSVALAFFALAAYVTYGSIKNLLGSSEPQHSTVGIVLAATSLGVMPFLSWVERRTGRELGSASVVADSKQTLLCTYLSGVLLVGLLLNSTLGWSWADPVAALVIAGVAVKEGIEAWQGDTCCTPPSALLAGSDADIFGDDSCGDDSCGDDSCGDDSCGDDSCGDDSCDDDSCDDGGCTDGVCCTPASGAGANHTTRPYPLTLAAPPPRDLSAAADDAARRAVS